MKTNNYILFAASLLIAAASCAKEIDNETPYGQEVTITVYSAETDDAKSTLVDGGTGVYWEPGDEVKLFYGQESSRFQAQLDEPAQTARFSGMLPIFFGSNEGQSTSTTLWAVYPYRSDVVFEDDAVTTVLPVEQTAKAGSFAKNMNITIAKANSFDLGFYNVCGGVRFSLTREGINKVVFKTNGGKSVAGKFRTAFEGGVPTVKEVLEGKDNIVLTMPYEGTFEKGKWYYICALPGTLSEGFTMRLETANQYANLSSSGSVTIKRGIFGQFADVDENLIFKRKDGGILEPEAVDLGLSVKWAKCNLGASKPEDYGDYYQWAGTTDVSSTSIYLDWSNCPYHSGSSYLTGWTKYVPSNYPSYWSGSGSPDNKTVLDPKDDVAHVKLGGKWRMPTYAEWTELYNNCTSEWTTLNGVKGRKFTSEKNGKSIFLPAAGYRYDYYLYYVGSFGYYWSSSLNTVSLLYAYYLGFGSGSVYTDVDDRCDGLSVRPVSE